MLIHAGAVLGADGFGFAPSEAGYAKIPQLGRVLIGDDVEIGAQTTVDRGAMEDSIIGRGCKLDDHVHIGHGATLGEHVIMCAYAGLAGSAHVGDWVVIGGHTGVNNRATIAPHIQVASMSGVTKDLTEKRHLYGVSCRAGRGVASPDRADPAPGCTGGAPCRGGGAPGRRGHQPLGVRSHG